jgi:DNA polymerase sigma
MSVISRIKYWGSLNLEILKLKELAKPSSQVKSDFTRINSLLNSVCGRVITKGKVSPFGSAVNGFWTPHSDIDFNVKLPAHVGDPRIIQIDALRVIAAELKKIKNSRVDARYQSKIPVLKWSVNLGDSVRRDYTVDVSVSNNLAVYNSSLLRSYACSHESIYPVGIALKFWAQSRGFNDRSHGTLSSFSLMLMLINFLQKEGIVKDLQSTGAIRNIPLVKCEGRDVRFLGMTSEEVKELPFVPDVIISDASSKGDHGQILHDFIGYYAWEYKKQKIRITLSEEDDYFLKDEDFEWWISNPFEPEKDVANIRDKVLIRREFQRAAEMIQEGKSWLKISKKG